MAEVQSTELYPALHQPGDVGLPLLLVENALGRAVVALQGAQVLAFQPAGQREMLWLSPRCVLTPGKAIRGGIPLCLPWFGPSPDGKVAHGFARTSPWSLLSEEVLENGATRLVLGLAGDATVSAQWPYAFDFRLELVIGRTLMLRIFAENCSAETVPLACAFHTYFAVPNVVDTRVEGLDGVMFIDKIEHGSRHPQVGDVTIRAMTDRVYLGVPMRQTLHSAAGCVHIDSDARCAVIWNIGDHDKNVADLGEGSHVGYLCVERGDVADSAVSLVPGSQYQAWMSLSY